MSKDKWEKSKDKWENCHRIYGDQVAASNDKCGTFVKIEKIGEGENDNLFHILQFHKDKDDTSKYKFEYYTIYEEDFPKLINGKEAKLAASADYGNDTIWELLVLISINKDLSIYESYKIEEKISRDELINILKNPKYEFNYVKFFKEKEDSPDFNF